MQQELASATMEAMRRIFSRQEREEKNELVLASFNVPTIFFRQFKNPLLLILLVATSVSFALGQKTDAAVIFLMLAASIVLGFWNEFTAEKTMADLLKKVSLTATVVRNGMKQEIPVRDVRVDDQVLLSTGSVVPADMKLTELKNLEINEAVISGESLPVAKDEKANLAFAGTVVTTGSGEGTVIAIGRQTKFGKIAVNLAGTRPETEFEKGLRGFGSLLVRTISIMAVVIFFVNALLGHPFFESLLFALAIAIGLTPELLPVIVTVSLAHGAAELAKKDVIVKLLVAIEDLGNMEVLCTDKTGTLTEGKISLAEVSGKSDLLTYALWCNSAVVHQKISGDAIDTAIWEYAKQKDIRLPTGVTKIAEEPFDYDHRAMFVVIEDTGGRTYIYKGAPEAVLGSTKLTKPEKEKSDRDLITWGEKGYRVIAVAAKKAEKKEAYGFEDAKDLELAGFLIFTDTPKKTATAAIEKLTKLGVAIKIVTGDNEMVTKQVCREVGVPCNNLLTSKEIDQLSDQQLRSRAWKTDAFVRTSPEQKLRIIKALQYGGHSVGFLGDGINDGPALHTADVGISVNSAVDVAKDTAGIVLLRKSLSVIADGIAEGRRTFSNTIKYVLMGTSSNFGNMFSAAGASFVLPFLPMTASQILLTNAFYDISQLSIPTDNVDPENLAKPRGWDIKLIKRFMLFFGPISSIYDFLTYGVMIFVFKAQGALFQTGWFIESLVTEILVVFVIRTNRVPFLRSRPSFPLAATCISVVAVGLIIPFSPLAKVLGFVSPPPLYFGILIVLTLTYLGLVEIGKWYLLKLSPKVIRGVDKGPITS